jgi:hypothetical protein
MGTSRCLNPSVIPLRRRSLTILAIGLASSCASVQTVRLDVTAEVRSAAAIVLLPPRFLQPASGREVVLVNQRISQAIRSATRLAQIDFRELTYLGAADKPLMAAHILAGTNLGEVAARTELKSDQILAIQPIIDRRAVMVNRRDKRGSTTQKRLEFHVRLDVIALGPSAPHEVGQSRAFTVQRADQLPPDDPFAYTLEALDRTIAQLLPHLKRLRGTPVTRVSWARESFSSMARTGTGTIRPLNNIPDEIARLTALSLLAETAYQPLRGRVIERLLKHPPGLEVTQATGELQVGDLITEVEGNSLRSVDTLARWMAAGRTHLTVLRGEKVFEVSLEQQP